MPCGRGPSRHQACNRSCSWCVQMKAQGKFYADKLDLLVSYLIAQPLQTVWDKLVPESLQVSTMLLYPSPITWGCPACTDLLCIACQSFQARTAFGTAVLRVACTTPSNMPLMHHITELMTEVPAAQGTSKAPVT